MSVDLVSSVLVALAFLGLTGMYAGVLALPHIPPSMTVRAASACIREQLRSRVRNPAPMSARR